MRRLILCNDQSPGDTVMMTAALRDLHAAYPEEYLTGVRTPSPAIFEHNLNVRPIPDYDGERIEMHYPAVLESNTNGLHFSQAFGLYLSEQLQRPIIQGPLHGDIHLSWEEKDERAYPCQVGPDPFWLIISGGKRDYTAKLWSPTRWQAVMDHFRGRIQFVQVGEAGHDHPPLSGVLDLRGQTTLRQLIRLVYHADGVCCGVTALMHLAAAVPVKEGRPLIRPCVVVAGAREPDSWERYLGHRYISNIGSLDCCRHGGCWKSRVLPLHDGLEHDTKICEMPTETDGTIIPKCLAMISVEDVVRAVESYL